MGKRFEGENPGLPEMLSGFKLLGLTYALGSKGPNTAFGWPLRRNDEVLEFHTVPGAFIADEIADLFRHAGLSL